MFKKKGNLLMLMLLVGTLTFTGCSGNQKDLDSTGKEVETEINKEESEEKKEAKKEKKDKVEDKKLTIDKPVNLEGAIVTLRELSLIDADEEDSKLLKITYDFENINADIGEDEGVTPFTLVMFRGFQDNVQVNDDKSVKNYDDIDFDKDFKTVKQGGKLEGVETYLGIDDLDKPYILELEPFASFDFGKPYSMELDLSTLE